MRLISDASFDTIYLYLLHMYYTLTPALLIPNLLTRLTLSLPVFFGFFFGSYASTQIHQVCILEGTAYGKWLNQSSAWANKLNPAWASGAEMTEWLRDGRCDGMVEPTGMSDYHLALPENCPVMRKAGQPFWMQNFGVGISFKYPTVEEQV
jgi:hypothetical protein